MTSRDSLREQYRRERDLMDRQLSKADHYISKYAADVTEAQRELNMWTDTLRDAQKRADELDILIDALGDD